MILTPREIVDIVLMSLIVGYIFSDVISRFTSRDILSYTGGFDWQGLKFAVMVTAPAVILHELAHKFVAILFGFSATFHAAYPWLFIGVILKLINIGFIFFVPAFVSITGTGTQFQYAAIAVAGPLMNAALWGISELAWRKNLVQKKYRPLVFLTARINMFLFIFNMLPIPGFDGSKVFSGIYHGFLG